MGGEWLKQPVGARAEFSSSGCGSAVGGSRETTETIDRETKIKEERKKERTQQSKKKTEEEPQGQPRCLLTSRPDHMLDHQITTTGWAPPFLRKETRRDSRCGQRTLESTESDGVSLELVQDATDPQPHLPQTLPTCQSKQAFSIDGENCKSCPVPQTWSLASAGRPRLRTSSFAPRTKLEVCRERAAGLLRC